MVNREWSTERRADDTRHPCARWDCDGMLVLDAMGVGTCPVCRMAERLDADGGSMKLDAVATQAEATAAKAANESFVDTRPLNGADARVLDSETLGAAQERWSLACRGQHARAMFERDERGDPPVS